MNPSHIAWEKERIIQKEVIVEEVHSFPSGKEPFQTENMTIGLCFKGSVTFLYDMQPSEMRPHCIGVILPYHLVSDAECTDDYTTLLIIVSAPLYEELIMRDAFRDYIKYGNQPEVILTDEQQDKFVHLIETIRNVSNNNMLPKRHEIIMNLFDLLFYALTFYRGEESSEIKGKNKQLYNRFYNLLIANYRQHHEISWYAGQLSLTPKYFSALVRQTTDKSAAEWINTILIMQAKRLLLSRRDMTVQQVAYELGFNENATFCRFFKAQTGLRPSEYRER